MTRGEAKRLGAALAAAGVIEFPGVSGKLSRAMKAAHGASSITGHWAQTAQRPAPVRAATIICADVATALLDGWSVEALRACSHVQTPATVRRLERAA